MSRHTIGLLDPLREVARKSPSRAALFWAERSAMSHGDLVLLLDRLRSRLLQLGIAPGARVATLLPNAPETAVLLLALCDCATAMPINPDEQNRTIPEILQEQGASHVILPAAMDGERLEAIRRSDACPVFLRPAPEPGSLSFDLAGDGGGRKPDGGTAADADVALVLRTSGSTGLPKRVPLTSANLVSAAWNVARSLALTDEDLCLSMMPMFHIGALVDLLLAPLYAGGAVLFTPEISTAAFFSSVAACRPTWYQAVPTMLRDILNASSEKRPSAPLSTLRFIRIVSQSLPERLGREFEQRFGVPLVPIYGMTETAGVIASAPLVPARRKAGSAGIVVGPALQIANEEGASLAPGQTGEIVVRGPSVMSGYEETGHRRGSEFRDGWLRTGDMGFLDPDGFLFVTGRIKDLINRGGEKISPAEIDRALCEHPEILEGAAYPVPHPSLDEEVGVAVVRAASSTLSEAAVRSHLRARLAAHKLPRHVQFLERLPRLPSGKLDRRALSLLSEEGRGAKTFVEPASEFAARLATIWREILKVPRVGMEDDFFDLGGDSLSATNLGLRLEEVFGTGIPAANLFEVPTLRGMERALRDSAAAAPPRPSTTGTMQYPTVSRNKAGWKNPLFWVSQGARQFDIFAGSFDSNRPLHGVGVFLDRRIRDNDETRALARDLAADVNICRPKGPLLLGGFCQDGLLAFRMAQCLREGGREVALLCLQDRLILEPYDGAVALFWSKRSRHSAYYQNVRPERGLAKFYRGPVGQWGIEADHRELYDPAFVHSFASVLEEALESLETGSDAFSLLPARVGLDPRSYRAAIRGKIPRLVRQGGTCRLRIAVTNQSPVEWRPTDESGIILASRWHVFDAEYSRVLDTHLLLDEAIPPGQTRQFELPVHVPMCGLPMSLEIDLLEDGVHWFGEVGRSGLKRHVFPLAPG